MSEPFQLVWHDSIGDVRVMGFVEMYVVYRRPGCVPSVAHYREFVQKFSPGKGTTK